MIYRPYGNSGIQLSVIGLGGHEYLPNGSSRGFNEHRGEAIKPGYVGKGYGGPQRLAVLETALENGVNFFDVTIDPEKEALGRNLREVTIPHDIFIQTRPEGMGYSYDPGNRKMADGKLLRAEIERCLQLLKRDVIDILNFPFLQSALDEDPEYLSKIRDNVAMLKDAQLIRFASADNFSGESTYLTQIESGIFNSISINCSFADTSAIVKAFPAAEASGMGVITREVFQKGKLFEMGDEFGVSDRALLARTALKWNISVPQVTVALVGAESSEQLLNALSAIDYPILDDNETGLLINLLATSTGSDLQKSKKAAFFR